MTNFTKEQLTDKNDAELLAIAEEMKIADVVNRSREEIIYDILDAQAVQLSTPAEPISGKRRTRIVKRNEADHVFSTNLSPKTKNEEEVDSQDKKDETPKVSTPEVPVLPKRKRGRPSKADIAAREAALKAAEEASFFANDTVGKSEEEKAVVAEDKKPQTSAVSKPQGGDGIPDFVAEQMRSQTPISAASPDVLDMEEVKRTLGNRVSANSPKVKQAK